MPPDYAPVDVMAVKDGVEDLADELRDLGLDFMLDEDDGNV